MRNMYVARAGNAAHGPTRIAAGCPALTRAKCRLSKVLHVRIAFAGGITSEVIDSLCGGRYAGVIRQRPGAQHVDVCRCTPA
ncbi:hypothetical protein PCAR4_410009 [Paraburkholderia caribensis]|nr:hypothetical protein PCAR4_410009 [Paraburkholderia caribensis]